MSTVLTWACKAETVSEHIGALRALLREEWGTEQHGSEMLTQSGIWNLRALSALMRRQGAKSSLVAPLPSNFKCFCTWLRRVTLSLAALKA